MKRVIFASSNHVVGYYKTTDYINAEMPMRPDGMYGVSKCFGESLSRYYYDRFGIETVCIRIGSSFPEPINKRMMVTYFSYNDLVELLRCAVFTPRVGHTISFGVSNNPHHGGTIVLPHTWVSAKDSSAAFANKFPDSGDYPAKDDITTIYQAVTSCSRDLNTSP